jgi:hypothetical protein
VTTMAFAPTVQLGLEPGGGVGVERHGRAGTSAAR